MGSIQKSIRTIVEAAPREKPLTYGSQHQPIELRNAFAILEEAESAEDKVSAARSVYRVKRNIHDKKTIEQFVKNTMKTLKVSSIGAGVAVDEIVCDGAPSKDRTKWAGEVSNFYAGLYHDSSIKHGLIDVEARAALIQKQRCRLRDIRENNTWRQEPDMKIPLWLVLQTRAQFSAKGHSSPGLDGVTWRLLATIPINVVEHIRTDFEARLDASAAHRGPISDWSAVFVRLLVKTKCPRELTDWMVLLDLSLLT